VLVQARNLFRRQGAVLASHAQCLIALGAVVCGVVAFVVAPSVAGRSDVGKLDAFFAFCGAALVAMLGVYIGNAKSDKRPTSRFVGVGPGLVAVVGVVASAVGFAALPATAYRYVFAVAIVALVHALATGIAMLAER
jgi:hypothetical protein